MNMGRCTSIWTQGQRDGLTALVQCLHGAEVIGEAAKGIFHLKGLDWLAARLDHRDEALARWTGQCSGPVAVYQREKPRGG